jgi:ATP-dependent helicase HrpB
MPHVTDLPIEAVLPEITVALSGGTSTVLVAPPGAGKTTRVPLALLDAPWLADRKILVLEPRRLAARAAAERMASLLGEKVGDRVGLRARLDTRVGPRTRIEVITEGVFTRLILADPELTGVGAIVFDEFHERSLDADLGLALALDARAGLREDLRILIMSATLDGARVADLLGDGVPVIASEGRAFHVETRYLGQNTATRIEDRVAEAVRRALANEAGSILVFLPGQGEIARTAERLEAAALPPDVDLVQLFGALDSRTQARAIEPPPPGRRKVVLATSIAETSHYH